MSVRTAFPAGLSATLLAGLCAAPALAASASASSTATVYRPMTLASLLDLNFGTVVTNATGGEVLLDIGSSSRNCTAPLVCLGSYAFATLYLTGSDATVQVTYNPNVQLTGPGSPMDVEVLFPGGSGALVNITGGATTIAFGAKLMVNPAQTPGPYTGQFSVDVAYP